MKQTINSSPKIVQTSGKLLFHGSFYRTDVLSPSFLLTGEFIQWDETENNKFLYASTSMDEAIDMGFASSLAQIGLLVDLFSTKTVNGQTQVSVSLSKESININFQKTLHEKLHQWYVYIIRYTPEWKLVNNNVNGSTTEYKRDTVVKSPDIIFRQKISFDKYKQFNSIYIDGEIIK